MSASWYYLIDEQQHGPVEEAALREALTSNQLPPDTFVWQEGMENWQLASELPAFANLPAVTTESLAPPPAEEAPISPAVDTPPAVSGSPKGCVSCHSPNVLHGYPTLLCGACREKFIRFPFPLWLKITAGVLGVLLFVAVFRIPREISAGVSYERGQAALNRGDYAGAVTDYQQALASYPDSHDILRGLALAAHRAGDQDLAMQCAGKLVDANGQVDKNDVPVLNEVKGNQP